MRVELVPTAFVHQHWALAEPHIAKAIEWANEDFTLDQLHADVGQGRAALYWVKEGAEVLGAAVVSFQNNRNKRVAFVLVIGGNLMADQGNFDQFASLLKQAGATHVGGAGRPAIMRLWSRFGFKEKSVLFERPL